MKKHYCFFLTPLSPFAKHWVVSGVEIPDVVAGEKADPIPVGEDVLAMCFDVVHFDGVSVPLVPYDKVGSGIHLLYKYYKEKCVVAPLDRGGFMVDAISSEACSDAE